MLDEIKRNKKYTIISATYNVERYLDKFFKTIVAQSLIFEKYICIIIVDDGSTDNSQNIIKKWIQKYPQNIQYIKKENGGQSSARNLGLLHVKTKWVTFIDPDDFVSNQYFENVDTFLKKNKTKSISLVSCKLIYYFEHLKTPIDYHPLRYNFREKESLVSVENLEEQIQLSASATFFNTKLLHNLKLKFNSDIKPNFEDGHFIGMYLLAYPKTYMGFLSKSKYFYRKRRNSTSTIDQSWYKAAKYDEVLRLGYLDLFKKFKHRKGYVPIFIQRTILYDLMWHYKRIINTPNITNHLTNNQKERYLALLSKLFEYIDSDTIMNFELAGCLFYHKIAFMSLYKQDPLLHQMIYIDRVLKNKSMIYFHYYSYNHTSCNIYQDGTIIKGLLIKKEEISFMSEKFIIRYDLALHLDKNAGELKIEINGLTTYFNDDIKKDIILIRNIKTKQLAKVSNTFKSIARKVFL